MPWGQPTEGAPGSGLPAGSLQLPLPPLPLSPQHQASVGCVSARWQRTMCQETIAIKNSLGFILSFCFFSSSFWALLPPKEATKPPPVTQF